MRVENHSAFHRTAKLYDLVRAVVGQVPEAADATFVFEDLLDRTERTGGYAEHFSDGEVVIKIQLSRWQTYPYVSEYPIEAVARVAGHIELTSWQEEVLLVLLHEGRHVRQFKRQQFKADQVAASEIDAERFAIQTVKRFRRTQKKETGTILAATFAI